MLTDSGLTAREMVLAVNLVTGYTRGAARNPVDALLAEARTGVSDDDWWAARSRVFARFFDPARYPTLVAVQRQDAFDERRGGGDSSIRQARDSFEFGLARVLDGIEAYLRERRGAQPADPSAPAEASGPAGPPA